MKLVLADEEMATFRDLGHQTDAVNFHLRCETSTRCHRVFTAPLPFLHALLLQQRSDWKELHHLLVLLSINQFQLIFSFFHSPKSTHASCQRSVILTAHKTPSSSTHVLYSPTPTLDADSLTPSGFTIIQLPLLPWHWLFCFCFCCFFTIRGLQKKPAPCGVIYESCGEMVHKTHCGFIHI